MTLSPLGRIKRPVLIPFVATVSLIAFTVFLAGCGGGAEETAEPLTPVPVSSPEPTEDVETAAPTPVPTEAPEDEKEDEETGSGETGMSELLYRLSADRVEDPGNAIARAALAEIAESGDPIYIAALTDLIQVPLTRNELLFNFEEVLPVMQQLSGQSFEYEGKAWVEWQAQQPDLAYPKVISPGRWTY